MAVIWKQKKYTKERTNDPKLDLIQRKGEQVLLKNPTSCYINWVMLYYTE